MTIVPSGSDKRICKTLMSRKHKETESPTATLKNEFARQRWDLFHRAIAHAKQSNNDALNESDAQSLDGGDAGPLLSIVR